MLTAANTITKNLGGTFCCRQAGHLQTGERSNAGALVVPFLFSRRIPFDAPPPATGCTLLDEAESSCTAAWLQSSAGIVPQQMDVEAMGRMLEVGAGGGVYCHLQSVPGDADAPWQNSQQQFSVFLLHVRSTP